MQNVWFPVHGQFDHLHPEYEVMDWRGRSYFADFTYLPPNLKFIWEIKGYGSHVQDMDRKRYCEELNRELFLQILGFRVVSFAYDDVANRPELCMNLLRMLLSRYQTGQSPIGKATIEEKEVIRLGIQLAQPIRPKDVAISVVSEEIDVGFASHLLIFSKLGFWDVLFAFGSYCL